MYNLLRKGLFKLTPETAHQVALDSLSALSHLGILGLVSGRLKDRERRVMGINFPNPIGLAAGLDKNGEYIKPLAELGFGHIEIGTVTPKPQAGNPKPRLFRLPESEAIINRMGFNNKGVDYLVEQVIQARFDGILGINIGKNKDTSSDDALSDYALCLEKVYQHASYITVNLSSPNTPGLRDLQFGEPLRRLLGGLKEKQLALSQIYGVYRPIAVKLAPDMEVSDLENVAETLIEMQMDGIIATNTTISRHGVEGQRHCNEAGGLSGRPLLSASNFALERLALTVDGKLPIIGVGGISSAADAAEKLALGADLVQIYTSFIYQGPGIVRRIRDGLIALDANA